MTQINSLIFGAIDRNLVPAELGGPLREVLAKYGVYLSLVGILYRCEFQDGDIGTPISPMQRLDVVMLLDKTTNKYGLYGQAVYSGDRGLIQPKVMDIDLTRMSAKELAVAIKLIGKIT